MRPKMTRPLIVGVSQDSLVFVELEVARELATVRRAVQSAATWGELRRALPPDRFLEAVAQDLGGELPADQEGFDPSSLGAYQDGDWPEWPAQLQIEWMPADVRALGELEDTVFNGPVLKFAPERQEEIVHALWRHGFSVSSAQQLLDDATN